MSFHRLFPENMADTEVDSAVAPAADAGSDTVKEKEEKVSKVK